MRWLYALVGVVAALAGTVSWLATRTATPATVGAPFPGSLMAATFKDVDGRPRSLGEFQGKVVVLNFWATWCAPCRQEMPAFQRLQERWGDRGVQFVGVSPEDAGRVTAFARPLGITYPLWVGGEEVAEMSRRLGNNLSVLPHTVVFDRGGMSVANRVGTYSENEMGAILSATTPNAEQKR